MQKISELISQSIQSKSLVNTFL